MPKTRNVTRAQWDAAYASTSTRRHRNENENTYESEKENTSRVLASNTRTQTRSRARAAPLGASNTTILGVSTGGKGLGEKTRTASKGKGKPTKAPLKQKKMPLQDITHHFLPAPEAANRGEEREAVNNDEGVNATPNINNVVATVPAPQSPNTIPAPKFTSPLPPSSPPSEWVASPALPEQSAPAFFDDLHRHSQPQLTIPEEPLDPWAEFDGEHDSSQHIASQASSNSDPFGFVSLERKLKAERELVASLEPQGDFDEEDDLHVPVADTSSPRPVRRLRRSQSRADQEYTEAIQPVGPPPASCAPPPKPHKDKQKHRRLSSHEGHDIFSPCASSLESSPSPSKSSARKRPAPNMHEDPLDEFNEELDRSYEVEKSLKKARSDKQILEHVVEDKESNDGPQSMLRKLRPREKRQTPKEDNDANQIGLKPLRNSAKSRSSKKTTTKPRSAGRKKEKAESDVEEAGEDLEEKWQRERQERVEFFKRLEDYHVEEEEVYII